MAARRPGLVSQMHSVVTGVLRFLQALATLSSAELKANAAAMRGSLLIMATAMVLLLIALTLLIVALVLALAMFVGPVGASLIVAAIAAAAGLALGRHGLARLEQTDLAPVRSIATLQAQIDRITGDKSPPAQETHDDQ